MQLNIEDQESEISKWAPAVSSIQLLAFSWVRARATFTRVS
jgi:hypothetical protein